MRVCPIALQESLDSDLCNHFGRSSIHTAGAASFLATADAAEVAAYHLRQSLMKKFVGDAKDKKQADLRAFELFLEWNSRCEAWEEPETAIAEDRTLLGEFRNCFAQCFETPYGELVDFASRVPCYFRTGPGAAVDAKLTDAYTKLYAGDMSVKSEEMYWHYYDSTLPFECENEAERIRSASFDTTVVPGSKLGFAAKNAAISRTRTTEPSLSMIYQLATGTVLEEIIQERYGINLSTQPDCNRELSRRGSLDGSFSTTDLSSASDATAVKFFKWALPYREITNWFMFIRSDCTENPYKRGEQIKLSILSSMGNGFTFPLMTLIFLCVVEACYIRLGIPFKKNRLRRRSHLADDVETVPGNFAVFGDDIIVDSRAFHEVNHLLGLLGYAVNEEKSFGPAIDGSDGSFRESCGTDWFLGQNVRGVYCKLLNTPQRRYALINRLNAWSSNWDVPLPHTVGLLMKSVWYLPVPPWEAVDSGVIVPFNMFQVGKRDEYGGYIYRSMRPIVLKWDPKRGLTGRHLNRSGHLRSATAEDCEYHAEQGHMRTDDACYRAYPFINLNGLVLAAVAGYYSSSEGISVRSDAEGPRYKKTTCTTPGWAYTKWSSAGFTPAGWATFEKTVASINLRRET